VLEDQTFDLKAGQWTQPIRTKQGWIILKVTQHIPGGVQPFAQVEQQVEEALYMSQMEPAIRAYLTRMRNEAFIDIAPGYEDSGASPNETKPIFSAYVPPAPKKKAKVERTRYREAGRGFRDRSAGATPAVQSKKTGKHKHDASERAGKKEKIRYGQAPRETLPTADNASNTVDAGALPETATNEPVNPLEPQASTEKSRFSDRARTERTQKVKGKKTRDKKNKKKNAAANSFGQAPPDAAEVANRQLQSAPLGLDGDTSVKKKKKAVTTTGPKTRMSQDKTKKKKEPLQMTPAPAEPGAPAPAAQNPTPQQ
jgi:peptidyl-prolyl cis-trans isomerase SurA